MAREIGKLEDWVEYTPNIDNNRDDPDPLTVELRPMNGEEFRAYQRGLVTAKGNKDLAIRSEKVTGRILSERVRNVRGYKIGDQQITTGEQLFKYGEPLVYDDVFEAIVNISTLKEGLLKKSTSRSASLPAATATRGLGAAPAARVAGTETATSSERLATATPSPQTSASPGLPSSSDAPGLS